MKKICLLYFIFMSLLIAVTAQAGEWVLWELDSITGKDISEIKKTKPIDEFKTLKKCQKASEKSTDHVLSWAKNKETIKAETVSRTKDPEGVIYSYTTNYSVQTEFRCYPYGVVPTKSNE